MGQFNGMERTKDMHMTSRARTKIVATIGPATASANMIEALHGAGVSVFRLNFSHGDPEQHRRVAHSIREVSQRRRRAVAILQDLQGPKLRIGELDEAEPVILEGGADFRICTRDIIGSSSMVSTSYEELARDLKPGDPILIDDGRLRLEVAELAYDTEHGDIVTTRVIQGGTLKPRKGINLPLTEVSSPALTEKDRNDLNFGVGLGVDMIALSFVRHPADVELARKLIFEAGGTQPVIAKIEKPQAIDVLPEIIDAADGVMVARGDLGVELSAEAVPLIQKRIIRLANAAGKPVITATQMLESMIFAPQPTRAEASDVANAILDGTDAVMLSGETAVGDWPVEAVETMTKIANVVEQERTSIPWQLSSASIDRDDSPTEAQAAGHAARALADDLNVEAIVVLTRTGHTAQRISQERPIAPIIAFTDRDDVGRRLALWHGVVPIVVPLESTIDELIRQVSREVVVRKLAAVGDRVVIVGANPRTSDQASVFLEIHTISE